LALTILPTKSSILLLTFLLDTPFVVWPTATIINQPLHKTCW
jgi:hypothetical protein